MPMSEQYRLMIYFVVATLRFYRDDVKEKDYLSIEEFRKENLELWDRVGEEAKNTFEYELSWEQMSRGIEAYLCKSLSVKSSEAYVLQK